MAGHIGVKDFSKNIMGQMEKYPIPLQLLGSSTDGSTSCELAKQLARKTGCQCFVSFNVPDETMYPSVEKYILELVDKEPGHFYFE